MKPFSIIVAMDQKRGIGKNGFLPWYIPEDLKYFQKITSFTCQKNLRNAVIMGRRTWESIPQKFRPLAKRDNYILTRNKDYEISSAEAHLGQNLDEVLALLNKDDTVDEIFVIGGQQIYDSAINHPLCNTIFVTEIMQEFDCDTFFPSFEPKYVKFLETSQFFSQGIPFRFTTFRRC